VADKMDVQRGTVSLMILRTLEVMGPIHGFGIQKRIEDVSRGKHSINYGTLYPVLLKLEQEGFIRGEWRPSENKRRAKFYALTRAGRAELARETKRWHETTEVIGWFLAARRSEA